MGIVLTETVKRKKKIKTISDYINFNNIYVVFGIFLFLLFVILSSIYFFYKFYFISKFDSLISEINKYNSQYIIMEGDGNKYLGLEYQEKFLEGIKLDVKKVSEEKQKNLIGDLSLALPDVLEKEFVITFFEDLFLTISTSGNPVVLNSVNIGSPVVSKIDIGSSKNIVYKKYPISLGFSSSDKNYDRILDIIQISGLFDKRYYFRGEILPVMTTSSVTMNFEKNNGGMERISDSELKSRSLQIFMYSFGDKKEEIKK